MFVIADLNLGIIFGEPIDDFFVAKAICDSIPSLGFEIGVVKVDGECLDVKKDLLWSKSKRNKWRRVAKRNRRREGIHVARSL